MPADFLTDPLEQSFPETVQPVPVPPSQENLDAILLALEAVESGMQSPIQVSDLAAAAGYSLFHFTRLFNRIVHHSPFDYLIRRRLSQAAHDLKSADTRILDIALTYQFNSHESFTRAFKRMFGIPPSQCRGKSPDPHLALDPVDSEMLGLVHSGSLVIRERMLPELTLTGLVTDSEDPDDCPISLREHLNTLIRDGIISPLQQATLRTYPPGWQLHGLQIMAGVLDSPAAHNPALFEKTLPSGTWASFACPHNSTAASLLRRFIYQTWLTGIPARLREPVELEILHHPEQSGSPSVRSLELLIPLQG
jgi:AraC family transcriptional regulator